ncbi:histidine phosphatase family protein [Kitasatospora sp. NPDC048545]|uniref:SixA phosphatase family protein n=1 Tax=Kitasatospora sp. NPDC048545 TaxID=3157208 RepID=UPI0033F81970
MSEPTTPPRRTLIVLRHAKSAWPPDVPDRERPLGPRGRRDAPEAGRWLRRRGLVPDTVVCSPARRARETWELAGPELREQGRRATTVLLVGHKPALEELILALTAVAQLVEDHRPGVVRDAAVPGEGGGQRGGVGLGDPDVGVDVLRRPGVDRGSGGSDRSDRRSGGARCGGSCPVGDRVRARGSAVGMDTGYPAP